MYCMYVCNANNAAAIWNALLGQSQQLLKF